MKRFLRDPMVAFLGMGLVLFLMFLYFDSGEPASGGIVVDEAAVRYHRTAFIQQYQRPPTKTELTRLLHQYIEEEAMYQEALRLGADKHDEIVRRRLIQTVEFMYQDRGEEPLSQNCKSSLPREAPPLVVADFEQRFFVSGAGLMSEALMLKRKPDFLPLGGKFNAASPDEVRGQFGEAMTRAVFDLPVNTWHGPVTSAFGTHWIRVTSRKVVGENPQWMKEQILSCVRAGRKELLRSAIRNLITEHGVTVSKEVAEAFPRLADSLEWKDGLRAPAGAP